MFFFRLLFLLISLYYLPCYADVNHYFSTIQSNPNALYAFFKTMPKGGELHYHLAGGAYPEEMIAVAGNKNYCLDSQTLVVRKSETPCQSLRVSELMTNPEAYQRTVRAWSMKNFIPVEESGEDHFFATFFKFMPLMADSYAPLLADIMQRAANQHALYLEIMLTADNGQSMEFDKIIVQTQHLAEKRKLLLNNTQFQNNIANTVNKTRLILEQARKQLGCDKASQIPVCNLTVKFQYYALREQPRDAVFAQLLNGFEAAARSNDILGINLVQAEDGLIALRDYSEHMQIVQFLHATYPSVHIALHAGELNPESVPPEALRSHIHDALFIAHAERIGHGVSITYENKQHKILQYMRKASIPIEINLISNRKILNIAGKEHPLRYYLANGIPVVLSTDDEGVLRTDLTRQYVEAVRYHHLDYQTLKALNRNTLTYSFLPGESLWADKIHHKPIAACQNFEATSCQAFLQTSEKARLEWELEKQLARFEKKYDTL